MFYDGGVLLHVTMQLVPTDGDDARVQERDELLIEAEDYDAALAQAENRLPAGWQLIALRVDRAPRRGVRS